MATRSRIGVMLPDRSVLSIYSHWDGYPEHHGVILAKHYKTIDKVFALIALGDISILEKDVAPGEGIEHSFKKPAEGVTVAYNRDRGESWHKPRRNETVEEFIHGHLEEYGYIFIDGKWFVIDAYRDPRLAVELTDEYIAGL